MNSTVILKTLLLEVCQVWQKKSRLASPALDALLASGVHPLRQLGHEDLSHAVRAQFVQPVLAPRLCCIVSSFYSNFWPIFSKL